MVSLHSAPQLHHHGSHRTEPPSVVIGRGDGAGVSVSDPTVTRMHAEIRWAQGLPYVRDLGSETGVRVNGKRLIAPAVLGDGDVITVGREEFVFRVAPTGSPSDGSRSEQDSTAGARLEMVAGGNGQSFALAGTSVLGRAPQCDVRLEDESVSRRHAVLRKTGETWVLSDLASTNGTCVNDRPLQQWEARPLRPGDVITLGAIELAFSLGDVR